MLAAHLSAFSNIGVDIKAFVLCDSIFPFVLVSNFASDVLSDDVVAVNAE